MSTKIRKSAPKCLEKAFSKLSWTTPLLYSPDKEVGTALKGYLEIH